MSEVSRGLASLAVVDVPRALTIEVGENERAALARRFDLIAVEALTARVRLFRALARDGSGDVVRVVLDLDADIIQRCVVTLEPLRARIAERGVETEFALAAAPAVREVVVMPDGADPPQPLDGEHIDVGELVAQQLALALDPYPRTPGAELAGDGPEGGAPDTAFAALGLLRQGGDGTH